MRDKKALEFSFGWIFAIMAGGALLFLAIYGVMQLIGSEEEVQTAQSAQQILGLLTPLEAGFEEGKAVPPINLPGLARIYNDCDESGDFGIQSISTSISSGIGEEWSKQGIPVSSYNNYLFSGSIIEGEKIYAFSKPFEMPFKISAPVFLWAGKYCFVSPPREVEDDVINLNLQNINISEEITKCDKKSKKVCFYSEIGVCDIIVMPYTDIKTGVVKWKGGQESYYYGPLLYGAIFSDSNVYECQVKRLMKRASQLALVYKAKSELVAARSGGCGSGLQADLEQYSQDALALEKSDDLANLQTSSEIMKSKNSEMTCRLWGER